MNNKILFVSLIATLCVSFSSLAATPRLTTPWTNAALQAAVPLPEYPRPQMTRPDWINLNGKWSYNGGGAAPNADAPPATAPGFPANPEQILVPYPVESYLSGIQRMNDRNMWYKRSFTIPSNWSGRRVQLHFGAVDRKATVYINGQWVGQHSGGFDAFSFDITPFLRAGSNDVVVGAFDPTDGMDMLGKQTLNPGGIFYTPSSGIWQTVWLEATPTARITRLDMTPDVANNRLRIIVRAEGLSGQTVEAIASTGATQIGTATGSANVEFTIPVSNPRLWSPDDPFLYDLKVRLRSGTNIVDEVGSYFGMRTVSIGTIGGIPRPLINGKYVFQFGPLDQGFWPDGLYTAPTDAALLFDLQATKDLGFNMVRKHIKVEPQRWFYWADKLGLLVWQDMPHAWDAEANATVRARVEAQDREIVDEHRSSPSIISWVIFNESWGDFEMQRMAGVFKGWDSSRLINTHSGINFAPGDSGFGDIIDIHDYPGPIAPNYQTNRPAVLGEYGGNGLRVDGHMWNSASTCCYVLYPDSNTLTNAYIAQVNSVRELATAKGLSAAVYTEITDVEDELNGFYTYDRYIQKMDFARVRNANRALIEGIPYFRPGASYSFRTVTPSVTDRYIRHSDNLGYTAVVSSGSAEALKKDASWRVVTGLGDSNCVSLESVNFPGKFLRHSNYRLRTDTNDNSTTFAADATFCPRPALDGGGGVSLESKNFPGYYIRHRSSEIWIDPFQESSIFRADASWSPINGWWRSAVIITPGNLHSLRVLTPGFDNRFIRHNADLAFTEVVNTSSDAILKQDASWRLVAGLADPSCYSFESRNYPGQYLRHAYSRLRKAGLENTDIFRSDATFCSLASPLGGVRFASINYPDRYIRHYAGEVWIADGRGGDAWNSATGFDQDSRWSIDAPWSETSAAFSLLLQAEAYTSMNGVQLEATTDAGGGQNVGWIDANDWMAYANINFPTSGSYRVEYRVASVSGATVSLDLNAGAIQLGQVSIPPTGGWQTWSTVSHTVNINAGTYSVGVFAPVGGWNINWIRFTKL